MGHSFATEAPLFFSIGILLLFAWGFGEAARRLNQPAVLGEIIAGIVLGPTILGSIAPDFSQWIFPSAGYSATMMEGITTVSIALFLLVAGMEVEFSTIIRSRRIAAVTGFGGLVIPFVLGFVGAYLFPSAFGATKGNENAVFALFMATAMSISALPVIARTLMDLNLYRSEMGMVTVAAAVMNDLVGWLIFAVVLSLFGVGQSSGWAIAFTLLMTLMFAVAVLTAGRKIFDNALPWVQAYLSWPAGVLGFVLVLTFMGAAFAEFVGIHAIFGSFLIGVALGDSKHLTEHTKTTIGHMVSFVFAPLFFAGIGLKVNIVEHFDPLLILVILVIAFAGKILGSGYAAHYCGLPKRESFAIGVALNARGAMEIILALLALQLGVIDQRLFVALLVMALATSLVCGPAVRRILQLKPGRRFVAFLSDKYYIGHLNSHSRNDAIAEISHLFAKVPGVNAEEVRQALLERENLMSTGLGNGVAVPHTRVKGLLRPVVAVGISHAGIDFDASDGKPAHIILVILAPEDDNATLLNLFAEIARSFSRPEMAGELLETKSFAQFLSHVKITTSTTH